MKIRVYRRGDRFDATDGLTFVGRTVKKHGHEDVEFRRTAFYFAKAHGLTGGLRLVRASLGVHVFETWGGYE